MANAVSFVNNYAVQIQTLINTLNTLQSMNLQITDDPTLLARYFGGTVNEVVYPAASVARTDITVTDVTNAQSAVVQMLFTYNSGSPTQASYLLKVLP